jgi:Tfp pilus assembly protein PilN
MNAAQLQTHWALVLASATGVVLLILAARHFIGTSPRGQLRRTRKALDRERKRLRKAMAAVNKVERQKTRLMQHVDRVKPRVLHESGEALADAKALAKVAGDRVLVAENHLRRVILEEFPPTQHERLRTRYLPDAGRDKKPFTF